MAGNYKNKDEKREQAKTRQVKASSLTPQQRIEGLNKRLGVNQGAKKERKRLNSFIVNDIETKKK